jgi:diadenylate cyclase
MPDFTQIRDFIQTMRWQDWVDILVVTFIIYQAIRVMRGTRSMQMVAGLAVGLAAYELSVRFQLLTLNWILSNFLTYIILILVILFQDDIRRALTQMARLTFSRAGTELVSTVNEVVRAAFQMAEHRVGALIAFEREVGLKSYIEVGTTLDALVSDDLILSIFKPGTPLHDGAVVVQAGRIAAAACLLPLSSDKELARHFGTRHRAAIGLTRETDAAVIVVSEERGLVSLVLGGEVAVMFDQNELRDRLTDLLNLGAAAEGRETEV